MHREFNDLFRILHSNMNGNTLKKPNKERRKFEEKESRMGGKQQHL